MTDRRKSVWRTAAALFLSAFALGCFWIVSNPQRPTPDAVLYEGIAANLAAGNGYSFDRAAPYRPEITRTPFVPALAAAVYMVIGRRPGAVLALNAVFVGLAVALGYLVALRLFDDDRAALVGAVMVILTPQVAGAANNVLTEAPAMLQVSLAAFLLLGWDDRKNGWTAPLHAALLGAVLASLVLNRTTFVFTTLVAGAYVVSRALAGRWRSPRAWLAAFVFCAALGAPVLAWSARNASLGLPFSPAPVGASASRVYDFGRYKEAVLDPDERLPRANHRYFAHWKRPMGPDELLALDRENREWLEKWLAAHPGRMWESAPARLLGLYSDFRISVWPPWPAGYDRVMWPILAWVSRVLWLLSLAGFLLSIRRPWARAIWLVPIATVSIVHVLTVCNPRYVAPLLPLLVPYGGVAMVAAWRLVRRPFLTARRGI
ncbi:MAG: glycosyltransferase family 39 protein [Deltaproteobacteria bacterium]|nr:glycosyltransferase family 39 protein [Deltaproteobacteria bacterium]